jgi:hypothetical protein
MSDSLGDLIKKRDFTEPPEIQIIKASVYKIIGAVPAVSISNNSYIIQVPGAAAAGALRLKLNDLKKEAKTNKRLVIRIG